MAQMNNFSVHAMNTADFQTEKAKEGHTFKLHNLMKGADFVLYKINETF